MSIYSKDPIHRDIQQNEGINLRIKLNDTQSMTEQTFNSFLISKYIATFPFFKGQTFHQKSLSVNCFKFENMIKKV